MKLLQALLLFLLVESLFAQTFEKEYDLFEGMEEVGLQILEYNDRTYSVNLIYDDMTIGISIVEFSDNGSVIWSKSYLGLSPTIGTFSLLDSQIIIGGTYQSGDSIGIYYLNLNGDLEKEINISSPEEFDQISVDNVISYNSNVLVFGSYLNDMDGNHERYMFKIDVNGAISEIDIELENDLPLYVSRSIVDHTGKLHLYYGYRRIVEINNDTICSKGVVLLDADLNLLEELNYIDECNGPIIQPTYTVSHNGDSFFGIASDENSTAKLIKINLDQEFEEFYVLETEDSIQYFIYDIVVGVNDEIICSGFRSDRRNNSNGSDAFVAKINNLGHLMWIRHFDYGLEYYEPIPSPENQSIHSNLFSLRELDNGDIVCSGRVDNPTLQNSYLNNLIVLRLDADGCIEDNCSDWFLLPSLEEEMVPEMLEIFPNPVNNLLYYKLNSLDSVPIEFALFDATGNLLFKNSKISNTQFTMDLSYLPNGYYYLKASKSDRSYTSKKVLRMH